MSFEGLALAPEKHVRIEASGFVALDEEPWLRLTVSVERFAGHWVELVYDLGLSDRVTRPVLRFEGCDSPDEYLPAASAGRGIWRGRVAKGCHDLLFSPVDRKGHFNFRVVSLTRCSVARRLQLTWTKPKWVGLALLNTMWAELRLADRFWQRALATPLHDYETWSRKRLRQPDVFDLQPNAPKTLHTFQVRAGGNALQARSSLREAAPEDHLGVLIEALKDDEWFLIAGEGCTWLPGADLALTGEFTRTACDVVYGDELIDGHLRFKPDWSPVLYRHVRYFGRAWGARAGWAKAALSHLRVSDVLENGLPLPPSTRVEHVRRPLVSRRATPADATLFADSVPSRASGLSCTVVIPTRDRIDLLQQCLGSLAAVDAGCRFDIVIVNNDSREPASLAYLDDLRKRPGCRVLDVMGSFNFSALCNKGAKLSTADTLLFLNNDTEAKTPGWMAVLASFASEDATGAVGARLYYPDGRVQHQGVVLGIDGHANHFERFMPASGQGHFHFHGQPREIGAVTGACLAVARHKFEAVNGFDEQNFPIEFSDIDLCLRLDEEGWASLMVPAVELVHHEAASRKVWKSQEKRYAQQVAAFRKRWAKVLRDDRFFHPMLSLYRHEPALG